MTAKELHNLLSSILAVHGDVEVMVNTATFPESENGTIMQIRAATIKDVQGADDSGPVGGTEPMLVIEGDIEWHGHGDPL